MPHGEYGRRGVSVSGSRKLRCNINEQDPQQLVDLGAFAYVSKPFKLVEIEAVVAQAVAKSESQETHLATKTTRTGRPA